jgi:hypothetical protein
MAQVDAEVFQQKEAMQEVKAGYLKVIAHPVALPVSAGVLFWPVCRRRRKRST